MIGVKSEYASLILLFVQYFKNESIDKEVKHKHLASIANESLQLRTKEFKETNRQAIRILHEDINKYVHLPIFHLAKYFSEQVNREAMNLSRESIHMIEESKDVQLSRYEEQFKNIKKELVELRYENLELIDENQRLRSHVKTIKLDTKTALAELAVIDFIGHKEAYMIQKYNNYICIVSDEEGKNADQYIQ